MSKLLAALLMMLDFYIIILMSDLYQSKIFASQNCFKVKIVLFIYTFYHIYFLSCIFSDLYLLKFLKSVFFLAKSLFRLDFNNCVQNMIEIKLSATKLLHTKCHYYCHL